MDNEDFITGVAMFALYTFLFMNFIFPKVKLLKEIQSKFRGMVTSNTFLKPKDIDQKRSETLNYINLIGEYKLEYKDISCLIPILNGGILITLFAGIGLYVLSNGYMIDLDSAIALIYGIIMLYMIFNAFKTYVPDPNAITERQYMVDHFNMSPSGLKEVADIKINLNQYGTGRGIRITSDIELRGYKYWFFLYDRDNSTTIINIVGCVDKSTIMYETFPDMRDFYEWHQTLEVSESIYGGKRLSGYLFVFDPSRLGDLSHPYRGMREMDSSTEWIISLQAHSYDGIQYEGEGLNFIKMDFINKNPNDKIIQDTFEKSKKSIMGVKKDYKIIS